MTHHPLDAATRAIYPNLAEINHRVTSDATDEYNCFAWAIGADDIWFSPMQGYAWPDGILRDETNPQSLVEFFELHRYQVCADGALEEGREKIAIYVHPSGLPTHAARQLATGRWTSKLGVLEDIEHETERDVEGTHSDYGYGLAQIYMRRQRP